MMQQRQSKSPESFPGSRRLIRPKVTKHHHKAFLNYIQSRNCQATRSGLAPVFAVIDPSDPDALLLVAVRPSPHHTIRLRTLDLFARISRAITAGKLHLCRYDPETGLSPYTRQPPDAAARALKHSHTSIHTTNDQRPQSKSQGVSL